MASLLMDAPKSQKTSFIRSSKIKPLLLILGAGHPFSLQQVTLNKSVLDWQLNAFARIEPEIHYVGGHDIDEVMRSYPRFNYHFNNKWESTGAVGSLLLALETIDEIERDYYILYSDILLRNELLDLLSNNKADATIAIDTSSESKVNSEKINGHEFIGLAHFKSNYSSVFRNAAFKYGQDLLDKRLSDLLVKMMQKHSSNTFDYIHADGLWAHAEKTESIARFVLGSKATTLDRLRGRLKKSQILPLIYFTREMWAQQPQKILKDVRKKFTACKLAIRSSAVDEDTFEAVNAGRYHTELDVKSERNSLSKAIDKVFESYSKSDKYDEVLVQPFLENVVLSGVAFSRVLSTGAPYRSISYLDGSDTTAVTAGTDSEPMKLLVSRQVAFKKVETVSSIGAEIVEALDEIESFVCHDALDLEFAKTTDGTLHTLQVRPLMIDEARQDRRVDAQIKDILSSIDKTLDSLDAIPTGQVGHKTIWSVMADWNPAEILGVTPGPLALELYRYLITDSTWSLQRLQSGYRKVGNWPLVRRFGGQAYVDVRASMNSFVPAGLSDSKASFLIEKGIEKLNEKPELHDKIEFEIIPTCIDFFFNETEEEIVNAYRSVTKNVISNTQIEISKIESLDKQGVTSLSSENILFSDKVRGLLDVSRNGALTFAHLARAGFVAAAFLRSAVNTEVISSDRRDALMSSITTVSGMMTRDAYKVRHNKLSRKEFIDKYGHLRPGTYDISTPAYRDDPERYIDTIIDTAIKPETIDFNWNAKERSILNDKLEALRLGLDAEGLLDFIRMAIAGREYAKYVFTKPLSMAINQIVEYGREISLPEKLLECMPLSMILHNAVDIWGNDESQQVMYSHAEERFNMHRRAALVSLPPVIRRRSDVHAFYVPRSDPNYITDRRISQKIRVISHGQIASKEAVCGRIVAITSADPGYDYIFSLGISGLVTAYGGPNSHMAIRAAEFKIPAVIGIGDRAFKSLKDGSILEIDAHKRRWSCVLP